MGGGHHGVYVPRRRGDEWLNTNMICTRIVTFVRLSPARRGRKSSVNWFNDLNTVESNEKKRKKGKIKLCRCPVRQQEDSWNY